MTPSEFIHGYIRASSDPVLSCGFALAWVSLKICDTALTAEGNRPCPSGGYTRAGAPHRIAFLVTSMVASFVRIPLFFLLFGALVHSLVTFEVIR